MKKTGSLSVLLKYSSLEMPWDGVNPSREPETYDAKNKSKDPVAYFKHKEALVAEEYVRVAEARVSL